MKIEDVSAMVKKAQSAILAIEELLPSGDYMRQRLYKVRFDLSNVGDDLVKQYESGARDAQS